MSLHIDKTHKNKIHSYSNFISDSIFRDFLDRNNSGMLQLSRDLLQGRFEHCFCTVKVNYCLKPEVFIFH